MKHGQSVSTIVNDSSSLIRKRSLVDRRPQRNKFTHQQQTVLNTLAYTAIFEHPLTIQELYARQFSSPFHPILTPNQIKKIVETLPQLSVREKLVSFNKFPKHVELRKTREHWATQRWQEAYLVKKLLVKIPYIKAVYVTGALAMNNPSHPEDDIDLLIVTQQNRVWLTRILVVPLAILFGRYRFHNAKQQKGWCFNLWLDEQALTLPPHRQSVYSAYEVVQAKQIIGAKNLLLIANQWIKDFLPAQQLPQDSIKLRKADSTVLQFLNRWMYKLQWWLMKNHHTIERIGLHYAFFHPRDTQQQILKKHQKLCHELEITVSL